MASLSAQRQQKLQKQEEYKRQLDAEGGGRQPLPRRRDSSLEPEDRGDAPPPPQNRHPAAESPNRARDGFVSSVKIRGEQPSCSENEKDAEAALKRSDRRSIASSWRYRCRKYRLLRIKRRLRRK